MGEKWPSASEMMVPDPATVDAEAPLSEAFGSMHSHEAKEIPVTDRGKLAGILSYETIGRRRSLSLTTKVRNLMSMPSTVPPRALFPEVAGRMLDCESNALCVVDPHDGKLLGTLSGTRLVRFARDLPSIADHLASEEMNPVITVLKEKDPSSTMFSHASSLHENAIPVVDAQDRLVGSVGSQELGEVFLRPMFSGHRDAGESHPAAGATVGSIMRPNPPSVAPTATIGECARLIAQTGVPTVYVLSGPRPIGTVSVSEILSLVARAGMATEGTYVQISGLAGVADGSMLVALDRVLQNGLKRIAHVEKPTVLTLHFTPHSSRRLADATVQAKLHTEAGRVYRASRTDWNVLGSVTTLLEELERQVKEAKSMGKGRVHGASTRSLPPSSVELASEPGLERRLNDALPAEARRRGARKGGRK